MMGPDLDITRAGHLRTPTKVIHAEPAPEGGTHTIIDSSDNQGTIDEVDVTCETGSCDATLVVDGSPVSETVTIDNTTTTLEPNEPIDYDSTVSIELSNTTQDLLGVETDIKIGLL